MTIDMPAPQHALSPTGSVRDDGIRAVRRELTQSVLDGTLPASQFPARYSSAVDKWLTGIFNNSTRFKPRGCVLIAVGGYGRNELYPGSDLDLVLLHHARRDYQRVAHEIWYEIWDIGIRLDHSVRTRREALSVANSDLKVILGLLDGRIVAGDERVAQRLLEEMPTLWRRNAASMLRDFDHQVQVRHEQFGELAFLLEPDLKQSAGGLRDIAALRALAIAVPELEALANQDAVRDAEQLITAARVIVHCRTNSANDRLLLQEQDAAAALLGFSDADALMAKVAESARTIASTAAQAWRRARVELSGTTVAATRPCQLGNGVVLRAGEVALETDAPASDPALVVAIGRAAIEHNVSVEVATLERLEQETLPPTVPWPSELREGFIALMSSGTAMIPVVESLDQRHLFERLIPEWTAVRNRPQRNAYHRFTVDRHLLEAVARCAEHLSEVERPDLLVMGALLHDIGKGYPGDHSEVGSRLAVTIATRMGFSSNDVTTIADLVAYHLVVPEFATRRDLNDPSTALVVAKLVVNAQTLELLATLTEIDSGATGPAAWGPWKADLVDQLVERVEAVLSGRPFEVQPPEPTPEQRELLAEGRVALRASGKRVTVVAPDRPGLLSKVAGVLALHGCNVRRATVSEGAPGMAIEVFHIETAFDRLPDWERVEAELVAVLDGVANSLNERLSKRDDTYSPRRPASATPARRQVSVDNDTSEFATIVEVQAPDRLGLLHDITVEFADEQIDVMSALVDTLGHEVIDTFYVRSAQARKLNVDEIAVISRSLERVIERVG